MLSFLVCSVLFELAFGIRNCKYFGSTTGPLLPIDVCTKYHAYPLDVGSYSYKCDAFGNILLWWYPQSDSCEGIEEYSDQALRPHYSNCAGDICDHVTIRQYQRRYEERENMCYKNQSQNFIEYSFVTDCWNSDILPDASWSLSCTSDSFSMKLYREHACNGDARNITELTEGCKWIDDFNISFPFYNVTIPSFNNSANDTYFEVTVCGDGTDWWFWFMVGVFCVIILLCMCCCGCIARWCCKPGKNHNNKRNIDPLIINKDPADKNKKSVINSAHEGNGERTGQYTMK